MLLDVADAGGTVGIEEQGEQLADKVGEGLALLHLHAAFGTGLEPLLLATGADFAPRCLLIVFTSRTLPGEELAAGTAIQSAGSNMLG